MAFEVVLPRLGWNMEEGILAGWRKKDGETVKAGEVLFEVESDKAVQEVEALESGVLRIPSDSPTPGTTVPVGTVIGYLVSPGEQMPDRRGMAVAPPLAGPVVPSPGAVPPAPAATRIPSAAPTARRHPAISPRARRAAGELGVEWTGLRGSGSSGRIVERDVRAAAAASPAGSSSVLSAAPGASTLTTEADVTELVRLRTHFTSSGAPVVPTGIDFVMKAAAFALREYPQLNARLERGSLVRSTSVNIGIEVETDQGLAVPVIRDVPSRTLVEVASQAADLIERARSGQLRAEEQGGGTLRIIDLGLFEIDAFSSTPSPPECAVLGLGRIVARHVVVDAEAGEVAIRPTMALSLTIDHRQAHGPQAARFLQRIKQYVEMPYLWLAGK